MLAILFKSIAIIDSDTVEKSIAGSDSDFESIADTIAIESDHRY
jgi:hypothetical protein